MSRFEQEPLRPTSEPTGLVIPGNLPIDKREIAIFCEALGRFMEARHGLKTFFDARGEWYLQRDPDSDDAEEPLMFTEQNLYNNLRNFLRLSLHVTNYPKRPAQPDFSKDIPSDIVDWVRRDIERTLGPKKPERLLGIFRHEKNIEANRRREEDFKLRTQAEAANRFWRQQLHMLWQWMFDHWDGSMKKRVHQFRPYLKCLRHLEKKLRDPKISGADYEKYLRLIQEVNMLWQSKPQQAYQKIIDIMRADMPGEGPITGTSE